MLKDYYYFLGISSQASPEEITQAYRKLSVKFHPDKNPNDLYFERQFLALQEAYDCLIDPNSRAIYNQSYRKAQDKIEHQNPPKIKYFRAELQGDKILLKWQTQHADLVKITPIGLVSAFGEKLYPIQNIPQDGLRLILHATNKALNKTALSSATIFPPNPSKKDEIEPKEVPIPVKTKQNHNFVLICIFILALLCWALS